MYTHMPKSQGEMLTAHGHMSSHSQVDPTGIQTAIALPPRLTPLFLSLHWWTQRGDGNVPLYAAIPSVPTTE